MYEDLRYFEDGEEEMVYEDELGGLMEDPFLFEDPEDPFMYEGAYEGMYEGEGMYEDEAGQYESWENMEGDGYYEADPFLGKWAKQAGRFVKKVAKGPVGGLLKGLAKTAATAAGGAIGGPFGAKIAGTIANQVIRESDLEGDMEEESDLEGDLEMMGANMEVFEEMEYLAALASETDNEGEADQFIGAIANLAGPLLGSLMGETNFEDPESWEWQESEGEGDPFLPLIPLAASLLPKVIPLVSKGIKAVGKVMSSNPRTRRMVRTLPGVAARTATALARQARAGRPLTPARVAQTMARQTAKTLVRPPTVAQAMQRNRANALNRVQTRGAVVRVPVRRPGMARPQSRPLPVRPAVVRRAVQGPAGGQFLGNIGQGTIGPSRGGYGYGSEPLFSGYGATGRRRRRIVRPRYCVY